MPMAKTEAFGNHDSGQAPVQGFLHHAAGDSGVLVLTHGAGGNCNTPLLVALAERFAAAGLNTLRCNLPFRQRRPSGPPSPSDAKHDQEGLQRALQLMKEKFTGPAYLAGSSYGGRQASILASGHPEIADGLLLLSYPLHPPGRPQQLRTAHFPDLRIKALFVSGTKDAFGSKEELAAAIKLLPVSAQLINIEGAGHGLLQKSNRDELPKTIVESFFAFFRLSTSPSR